MSSYGKFYHDMHIKLTWLNSRSYFIKDINKLGVDLRVNPVHKLLIIFLKETEWNVFLFNVDGAGNGRP